MIDTHTHVTSCRDDAGAVLDRARAAGVRRLVTIGSSPEEMAAAHALADGHPDVWTTAGIHPLSAGLWSDAVREEVRARAAHPRCVAIGEAGLDAYHARSGRAAPLDVQEVAFRGQLALARELALPIVIHCREADERCFELLAAEGPAHVVLHCFSAPARLEEAVARGWWVSFAGNVTYLSAADLADAARRCPADRLLLETDAPYLAPVPHRGRPNEPAHVLATLRFVAALRGVEPDVLAAQVDANADRAFPRLGPAR